jgi:hypothetical protein
MHHGAENEEHRRSRLRERRPRKPAASASGLGYTQPDGNHKKSGDDPMPRRRAGFSSGELGTKPSVTVGRK